jgi:tRNA dimethylallyltransferase
LLYNINFSETISDWELREKLKKEAEEKGNEYLHERLTKIDPEAAGRIHVNDLKRIIRALEVYEYTKKPISYHQKISREVPSKYRFTVIGLTMDREKLYERINQRVDMMLEKGLVEEVKKLEDMGYGQNAVAMQGLGYKEVLSFLRGESTLEEAVYLLKRDTRHYAKRQMTWFKRLSGVCWIDGEGLSKAEMTENVKYCIATAGFFL